MKKILLSEKKLSVVVGLCSGALQERGKTVAVAESCTGGMVSSLITDLPGASSIFLLGLVAYSNRAKVSLLNVPEAVIAQYGAVSRETAVLMAVGARQLVSADYGIGITGIAGPAGGSIEKPVGLVYISISTAADDIVEENIFKGSRSAIRLQSALTALDMLTNTITGCK